MAISKVKLPNNSVEDIKDARLPVVTSSDNGNVLGVSGGIWDKKDLSTTYAPYHTSGYVKKDGDEMSGNLTVPQIYFKLDSVNSSIYGTTAEAVWYHTGAGTPQLRLFPNTAYPIFRYNGVNYSIWHSGNFVAGTDYQAPIPANTYAPYNANGYLPLNGGTLGGDVDFSTKDSYKLGTTSTNLKWSFANGIHPGNSNNLWIVAPATLGIVFAGGDGTGAVSASTTWGKWTATGLAIGGSSPTEKLDVTGSIKASDNITSGGHLRFSVGKSLHSLYNGYAHGLAEITSDGKNMLCRGSSSAGSILETQLFGNGFKFFNNSVTQTASLDNSGNFSASGDITTGKSLTSGYYFTTLPAGSKWYRIFEFNRNDTAGASAFIKISRSYSNSNNEAYTFSVNVAYGGCISITQISGRVNTQLIPKIRVDYRNSNHAFVDFYYTGSVSNGVGISGYGDGIFQVPAEATLVGTALEFNLLANGLSTNGNITASGTITPGSDSRIKDSQEEISQSAAYNVIAQLKPKTWIWNAEAGGNAGKRGSGFVAQEVKSILPYAVEIAGDPETGFHSLNYNSIQGYEVAAIKGLIEEVKTLKAEIAELKSKIK